MEPLRHAICLVRTPVDWGLQGVILVAILFLMIFHRTLWRLFLLIPHKIAGRRPRTTESPSFPGGHRATEPPPRPFPFHSTGDAPPFESGPPSTVHPVERSPRELDRHLLDLVDLLDEIEDIKQSGGDNAGGLGVVEARLADLIELSDGEIISDTEWRPDRQRAVAVEQGTTGVPQVLASRRSGLAVGGRIVRKQEVVLSRPISET